VDVVFTVGGEIIVDYQGDLLDINSSRQQIGCDQDTGGSTPELFHDDISLRLVHVAVHGADGEIFLGQFVSQPIDLSARVAENNGLRDGDSFIQIGEGIEFPIFLFDGNVELFDTFKSEFVLLDEDADGIAHELLGDFKDVRRHCGREEDGLGVVGEELEDVVNLVFETALSLGKLQE
jgi:hypothetical protein